MSAPSESSPFPNRSIILDDICPPGVVAVELTGSARASELYPQERNETTTFGEKRLSEFSAGRLCAKLALAELGIVNFPLQMNNDRRPRWPDGIVGSISHTRDYCAALVARATDISAIGFDVECTDRIGEELWDALFTSRERDRLRALLPTQRPIDATIIFSAKEAFYKCHFAQSPSWLDFTDVEIEILPGAVDGSAGIFSIQPCSARISRAEYNGRFLVARGFAATSVVVLPPAT